MMRVRYKPWAEDYLKNHPDLVDMDVLTQVKCLSGSKRTTDLY